MAFSLLSTTTSHVMTAALQRFPSRPSHREGVGAFCFRHDLSSQVLSRRCATSTLALAGRRIQNLAVASSSSSSYSNKKKKKSLPVKDASDMDEDALEALFGTLDEDIKNGDSLFGEDGGDNLSDEDLDKLQQGALGVGNDDDDDVEMIYSERDDIEDDDGAGEDNDKEEEREERPTKLKTWQLRRLASALKIGRRKISIKSLAAEVCLDRAVVLQLLRDPPPNLVLMSATLTDKPAFQYVPENKPIENVSAEAATADAVKSEKEVKVPVHVMRNRWSAQKRLKITQVYTLERVYGKTRRPTNTMIDSIVHVTNLPRKTVVQWFEDKRKEDGVPHNRLPYRRSAPETVSSF